MNSVEPEHPIAISLQCGGSGGLDWSSRATRLSCILLLALIVCFLLQMFSPLRLCSDSLILLSMAQSAAQGTGFLDHGEATVFPPGYPALVAILVKAGLGHPWAIVALNALLCATGLVSFYKLIGRGFVKSGIAALNLCSLFLLSWVLVKHFCLPLTDIAFFAVSMSCLYVLDRAWHAEDAGRVAWLLCAGWALTVAAIAVRRIGIALIPALICAAALPARRRIAQMKAASRPLVALALVASVPALLMLVWFAHNTSTLSDYTVSRANIFQQLPQILEYRMTELGEILLNVPASRIPVKIAEVLPAGGLVLLILAGSGMLIRRSVFGPTETFLCGYGCILFVWPYYDARFWLPVIPLLSAFAAIAIERLTERFPVRRLVAVYLAVFALLGAGSIVYSTRITFAGDRFPERYGDDTLRATYCLVYQSCTGPVAYSKVKPKALELLRIYR